MNALPPSARTAIAASGAQSVITQLTYFSYDPHANNSAAPDVTTALRLAFRDQDSGAEIPVQNLPEAILFTVDTKQYFAASSTRYRGVCAFWNGTVQAYSAGGCASIPNPAPPGHVLTWNSDPSVSDPGLLPTTWSISGPLTAGCTADFLDCRKAAPGEARYLNPLYPLTAGRVTCHGDNGTASTAVLRLYYGDGCDLYNTNNSYQCYWSAEKQAFEGKGCVVSPTTSCACTHLSDFGNVAVPKVTVGTQSVLAAIHKRDLVRKVKYIAVTVFGARP